MAFQNPVPADEGGLNVSMFWHYVHAYVTCLGLLQLTLLRPCFQPAVFSSYSRTRRLYVKSDSPEYFTLTIDRRLPLKSLIKYNI